MCPRVSFSRIQFCEGCSLFYFHQRRINGQRGESDNQPTTLAAAVCLRDFEKESQPHSYKRTVDVDVVGRCCAVFRIDHTITFMRP